MITPMIRVVVAATVASKEKTLNSLRDWGLLHVLPLQTPENGQVSQAKAMLDNTKKVYEALPDKTKTIHSENSIEDSNLLSNISTVLESKKNAEEILSQSSTELNRLKAFGDFNPDSLVNLSKNGINIKLYSAEEKKFKKDFDCVIKEFKRINGSVFFIALSESSLNLPYTEIALPEKSISELKQDRDNAIKTIKECEEKITAYVSKKDKVGELVLQAHDELEMQIASAGMHSEIGLCFIQGYSPKEKLSSLYELAKKEGLGISVYEPTAEENIPTLLKHSKATKPIDALYNVLGIIPGYREIDISSVFLFFFSIFFAMIVGDAAYGLLFAIATFIASKKFKNAPRYPFQFLYLMSFCTIIWGFLNATYLGLNTSGDSMVVPAVLDICRATWAPDGLKSLAEWIRDSDNNKFLCFVLAVSHLSIAHLWNAWINRSYAAAVISKIGWLCTTWMMFFLACNMVLGHALPEAALYVGIAGTVLIIIGAILKAEWFSLGMLPLNLVSNLVDVISYIRLFAVGMAGYSVANVFSNMVAPLFGSFAGTLSAALILFFVHALNIILAAMGVAVHAVRLNTLEFSNNVGVEWSGKPFSPFKKNF